MLVGLVSALLLNAAPPAAAAPDEAADDSLVLSLSYVDPATLYQDLTAIEVDAASAHSVAGVELKRGPATLRLDEGVVYPLQAGGDAVGAVLDAQIDAGGGRFKGIRHGVKWDASDIIPNARSNSPSGLFLNGSFREGFAQLAPRGLSFEAWCYHPQIPELIGLARAFPDTVIVVNHFAGPLGVGPYADKKEAVFAQWRADFAELSTCPNVVAKLSAFGTFIHKNDPDFIAMMIGATVGVFGAERCLFGSNFPIEKLWTDYSALFGAFRVAAAGLSLAEQDAVFRDTAARVYRI